MFGALTASIGLDFVACTAHSGIEVKKKIKVRILSQSHISNLSVLSVSTQQSKRVFCFVHDYKWVLKLAGLKNHLLWHHKGQWVFTYSSARLATPPRLLGAGVCEAVCYYHVVTYGQAEHLLNWKQGPFREKEHWSYDGEIYKIAVAKNCTIQKDDKKYLKNE